MQLTSVLPGQQRAEQHVETGGQKPAPQTSASAAASVTTRLSSASFSKYPPQARAVALQSLSTLQSLPLPLLPLLLRELSGLDYRFPRERERIESQLTQLQAMNPAERERLTAFFRSLRLPDSLAAIDWVNEPSAYLDGLTAALWASGQMPQFREAAMRFAEAVPNPPEPSRKQPRQVFVVLDAALSGDPMYRKLRTHGVVLRVADPNGMNELVQHVQQRACAAPESYGHWYIDGAALHTSAEASAAACKGLTQLSYEALAPVRQRLLARARNVMDAERSGPEELRSLLAQTTPEQIGMEHADPVLAHFQLSLLTEGSGTQIFSTTFVQWAARECLRRAEPSTLLLRFTPRQAQQGMNEMLSGAPAVGTDPAGSLVDAEEGALYTWINLQRLSSAGSASFLVWYERTGLAVAIGPGLPAGTTSNSPQSMQQMLRLLS